MIYDTAVDEKNQQDEVMTTLLPQRPRPRPLVDTQSAGREVPGKHAAT